MIWHILGAVSLFFNTVKTDKIVSNNSELILTNKTKLVSNKTKIASSSLIFKNKEIFNKLPIKKYEKLALFEPTRDTIQ